MHTYKKRYMRKKHKTKKTKGRKYRSGGAPGNKEIHISSEAAIKIHKENERLKKENDQLKEENVRLKEENAQLKAQGTNQGWGNWLNFSKKFDFTKPTPLGKGTAEALRAREIEELTKRNNALR